MDALICRGNAQIISNDSITIEPDKSYKLSGSFKLAPDSKPSKFYFGIMTLDDKNLQIPVQNVNTVARTETETELTSDCAVDDTVIKIKKGNKWAVSVNGYIAFNVDDSGKKTDLPNRDTHVGKWLVSACLDKKNVYSGKNSANFSVEKMEKVNPIGGKWQSWGRIVQKLPNLKVGQKYMLQTIVRTSNDFDGLIGVWMRSNQREPVLNAANINLEWQKTGDKWQRLEGDFTPADKDGMLYLNIMANSGSAYFDDVIIIPAQEQNNLLSNGSFEDKLTNWNFGAVMGDVAATVGKKPDKRGNVLKMQINSIDKDGKKVGAHGAWVRLRRELIGLEPGKKYKIQLQVKSKDLNGYLGVWVRSDNTADGLSKGNINLVIQDTAGKWGCSRMNLSRQRIKEWSIL